MAEKLDSSFYLRPYRTVPGPGFEENREDLELLVEFARMIRPLSEADYRGLKGHTPYNPNDFFLDSFDAGRIPDLRAEVRRAGRRIAGQIAHSLGWHERVTPKEFEGITWTLFHTDLRHLSKEALMVGRWHGDRFTANPRGLWIATPGAAALQLACPKDQEGVAYCTQADDYEHIAAFAENVENRIVLLRGNSVSETTEDMIHCREQLNLEGGMDDLQYAMRIHWPG